MPHSILYIILSSIPMFVCAFWGVVLGGNVHRNNRSQNMLCIFMWVAASLYFGHFVVFNHLYHLIPISDTVYSLATLSVYPLFYLYILSLTGHVYKRDIWILLPGLLIAMVIGVCYALIPREQLHSFISDCLYMEKEVCTAVICQLSLNAHRLMKPIIVIQVILVLYYGFKKLWLFKQKVNDYYSNTTHRDLIVVRRLLVFFVITSCLSVVADLIGRATFIDSTLLMTLVMIPFAVMLFAIGYVGYHQHFTIDDLKAEMQQADIVETVKETASASLDTSKDSRRELLHKIDAIMEKEQLFLQDDLKLSDLANRLNTNRTYIHEALSLSMDEHVTSFSDYVNKLRIDYSIHLLQKNPTENIDHILYDCGFSSKSTFYRNFKKYMGMTPKEYLSHQKVTEVTPSSATNVND